MQLYLFQKGQKNYMKKPLDGLSFGIYENIFLPILQPTRLIYLELSKNTH